MTTPGRETLQILQSDDAEFTRKDWLVYISNLPQRAGVDRDRIRQLVLKELVDNALDEMDRVSRPGEVSICQDGEHAYTVSDQGRGFPDSPEELASRFSIAKAMVSSKMWRKPTRGCVGNGLRVIVGSVVSGGGRIIVKTRNQQVTLRPRMDGTTAVECVQPIDWPTGAAVTIEIDPAYPANGDPMHWAHLAIKLARTSGPPFARQPAPKWFDSDHLALNMLSALPADKTLAWFVGKLDRCTDRAVGQMVTERFGKGRLCRDVSRPEAKELLEMLQEHTCEKQIKPKQLGPMGREAWNHAGLVDGYSCEAAFCRNYLAQTTIPFLVEAWAATCEPSDESIETNDGDDIYSVDVVGFTINRSPAIVNAEASRMGRSRDLSLTFSGTRCWVSVPKGAFQIAINITSPYVPILGDNKSPSLNCFKDEIGTAVTKAISRSARNNPPILISANGDSGDGDGNEDNSEKQSQRNQVLSILEDGDVIADVSGDGALSFNQRALYYVVRALVPGLRDGYFGDLVGDFENEHGEIPGMFRNNRGAFYEPHSGEVRPLGTLTVREYTRSPWLYGSVLVCEKEDNIHMLRESGFAERWDCFLVSSSGFTTRALKDLIDHIGSTARDEPVRVFCMIDADAHGSMIYQTLVEETKARAARSIEVVNLGLFPWEALADGLQHETGLAEIARRKSKTGHVRRAQVADYIRARDLENKRNGNPNNEPAWENWLQDNRVELNAMTSPQRVAWVERKFAEHNVSKVVPPEEIARAALVGHINATIAEQVKAEALQSMEKWIREQTTERIAKIKIPTNITKRIIRYLSKHREHRWTGAIAELFSL